jgi:uncharacterized protein YqgC (DUF456 family)
VVDFVLAGTYLVVSLAFCLFFEGSKYYPVVVCLVTPVSLCVDRYSSTQYADYFGSAKLKRMAGEDFIGLYAGICLGCDAGLVLIHRWAYRNYFDVLLIGSEWLFLALVVVF